MSFAKKSTNKEDVKASASNYISASGFYNVSVLAAFVDTSEKGSNVVNFFVNNEGQEQVLYGNLRVTNSNDDNGDSVENKIGMKVFNHILVVADIDTVADPVEGDLPIGKEGIDKTVAILEDLQDIDLVMRIQLEYTKYMGKIQEKKVLKAVYRAGDNATAEEIVNDGNFGAGFEKDQKYKDNITYKDDLTAEDIEKWVSGGRKNTGSSGGGGKSSTSKTPSFGNSEKRFGNKKA